jgi:hypothetical protein
MDTSTATISFGDPVEGKAWPERRRRPGSASREANGFLPYQCVGGVLLTTVCAHHWSQWQSFNRNDSHFLEPPRRGQILSYAGRDCIDRRHLGIVA